MTRPDPKRVAKRYLLAVDAAHLLVVAEDALSASAHGSRTASTLRTAGEVRFIKDRSGDATEWAWNSQGPSEREMNSKFEFNPKAMEPLTRTLRSLLSALGFAMSGYTTFTKTKSAQVSPDGSLGGKGYIMKITDMRRQLVNCIEVLSALTDTFYDEVNAAHWHPQVEDAPSKRDRSQVQEIMNDVEEIRADPEGFAREEEAEMDADNEGDDEPGTQKLAMRVASTWLTKGGRGD